MDLLIVLSKTLRWRWHNGRGDKQDNKISNLFSTPPESAPIYLFQLYRMWFICRQNSLPWWRRGTLMGLEHLFAHRGSSLCPDMRKLGKGRKRERGRGKTTKR